MESSPRFNDSTLRSQEMTSMEAINRFATETTGHAPGTAFDYVITNWVVVQAILETVSGVPLRDLMDEVLFTPAGADGAFIVEGVFGEENTVSVEGAALPVPSFVGCAGGLAVTPADLIALMRYPYTSGHLAPEQRRALQTVTSPEEHYTLGGRVVRMVGKDGEPRFVSWLSGSNGDWKTRATYDPVTDTGHVALTASGESRGMEAARARWLEAMGLTVVD
ncbi:MAG: serine hydrolase domain-containing protein [Myxococcota bacterium]